ncbi:E3 ubiquitin-protein ligase RING1-like [Nicotiana sylvestris]|uniref:RING-type E3 ubiquitin transferase n=1 Tax=Nicotiana sylvestris TaxID=4096 RepID=A0A1U7V9U9_NICSY|nr:PREDICTED: E3 ubiquitin-protein ligase RING1-like [Nicotiana sylvestris]
MVLDQLFDLDMALTMPEPTTSLCNDTKRKETMSVYFAQIVDEMPTVEVVDSVCTVCMEGFESSVGGKQVSCSHVFHSNCLTNWLSLHNSCPLCRLQVTGGQQTRL